MTLRHMTQRGRERIADWVYFHLGAPPRKGDVPEPPGDDWALTLDTYQHDGTAFVVSPFENGTFGVWDVVEQKWATSLTIRDLWVAFWWGFWHLYVLRRWCGVRSAAWQWAKRQRMLRVRDRYHRTHPTRRFTEGAARIPVRPSNHESGGTSA